MDVKIKQFLEKRSKKYKKLEKFFTFGTMNRIEMEETRINLRIKSLEMQLAELEFDRAAYLHVIAMLTAKPDEEKNDLGKITMPPKNDNRKPYHGEIKRTILSAIGSGATTAEDITEALRDNNINLLSKSVKGHLYHLFRNGDVVRRKVKKEWHYSKPETP